MNKIKIALFSIIICSILTAISCIKLDKTAPGLVVYKTRADYYDKAFVYMDSDGIYGKPSYYNPRYNSIDSRISITNNDTLYTRRVKLTEGYLLASENSLDMAFLNLTIKEYFKYQVENGETPSNEYLLSNILDDNPFTMYYRDKENPRQFELSDTAEINHLVASDMLETYFERLK